MARPSHVHDGDLDVLIATRERPALVERLLSWSRSVHMREAIRIVDGSGPAAAERIADACRRHADALRIELIPCGVRSTFWERLAIGLGRTMTTYVAISGDDDFLVPDALRLATDRLRSDPSLSGIVGIELRRELAARPVTYGFPYGYAIAARLESTVAERLAAQAATDRPVVTFYAVRRTEAARDAHGRIATLGFDDDYDNPFGEFLDMALQIAAGRVAAIPRLIAVREHGSPIQQSSATRKRPLDRVNDARWASRIATFRSVLADALRDRGLPEADRVAGEYLDRFMARLLGDQLSKQWRPVRAPAPQLRYFRALWPPTLVAYMRWRAAGLPRAGHEVRSMLSAPDRAWLRRIHSFAEGGGSA